MKPNRQPAVSAVSYGKARLAEKAEFVVPSPTREPEASGPSQLCCCAFLCDNDGRITLEFGGQLPSYGACISAETLVSLIAPERWAKFVETVCSLGASVGWREKIHYQGAASDLEWHGSQTPSGMVVFATLTIGSTASQQHDQASDGSPKNADLEEQDTSELLMNVVHDLNNPISSIMSLCEYLAEYSKENLEPAQLEAIEGIDSSARRLLQLSRVIGQLCKMGPRLAKRAAGASEESGTPSGE